MIQALHGLHLLADGISSRQLERPDLMLFLVGCPKVIDMTVIHAAEVWETGLGLTGITIIAESAITVHVQGHEVHADIFSCKLFDTDKAIEFTRDTLFLMALRVQRIDRGWQ